MDIKINVSKLVDLLPDGKLKRVLKRIILVTAIGGVVAVVAFIAFTIFLAKNTTVEPAKPATKPTALVEEPADTTTAPDATTEPTATTKPKVLELSAEDTKTCTLVKSTLYAALFKYKLYTEAVAIMKDGYCIFEIKPAGITTAGTKLKAVLAKSLSSLTAPTTTGTDTYYALVLKGNKNIKDYNDLIYVIPGVSGTVPTKEEFSVPETVTNLLATNPNALADVGDTEELDDVLEKQAIQTDKTTCASIESCVNAALANEEVYKETAILGKNGSVMFAITATPKVATTASKLMNEELLFSLEELQAPKQTGKDVYYVYIECSVSKTSSGTMYEVGKISVITGNSKVKPTAKDFATTTE